MPGFFLTNSIQLSQFSALVNLTDPSLHFGMVDAFKCLERDQNNQSTVQELRLCTRVKIRLMDVLKSDLHAELCLAQFMISAAT